MAKAMTRRGLGAGLLGLVASSALAQPTWPNRPVRVVIPFAPGGSTDAVTRPVLDRLHQHLGQPFVIDNRGGAGSAIGTAMVGQSQPDGYTLLSTTASFVTAPVIQPNSYEISAFDPVAMLMKSPFAIMVARESPIRTLAELIDTARRQGDRFFFATAGAGSSTHFSSEYFNLRAKTRMQHVPYKGIGPALIGLLSGDVQMILTTPASAAGQIHDGIVRVLAYTSEGKLQGYPDAPTVKQSGLDFEVASWWAMFGPRGLSPEVRQRLNGAINTALREPAISNIIQGLGALPAPMDPDSLATLVQAEYTRWAEVAKVANIRVE